MFLNGTATSGLEDPVQLVPGEVDLDDGTRSYVMLLELDGVPQGDELDDIGPFGGWRAYLECLRTKQGRADAMDSPTRNAAPGPRAAPREDLV
jgi:hypothetical protein